MKKDYTVILMTNSSCGDGGEFIHLPGSLLIGSHTLCGWTDCGESAEEHQTSEVGEVNCPGCIDVVKESRKYTRTMVKT